MTRHLSSVFLAVSVLAVPAIAACSKSPGSERTPASRPAASRPWVRTVARPVVAQAVGLWRIPPAELADGGGVQRFLYDGETVTLWLMTEKEWMYRAPDDHYRLATRWRGDVLQYRPPFGSWTDLARFDAGRFETVGDASPRRYENVPSRNACEPDDLPLLLARRAHDYSIEPTDPSPR